ncbi:hypothetical protein A5634_04650 [Mycobacterium asiaticum]|uniref:UspA domain-containing protein n=1 Tax=Mycobacterium asiaticum TaxID=1790 RepID=A0A1A3NRC7_MYCAS|nr:hypothetical protein A5634_04650 [Mycobacterium asiaticum]
MQHNIIADYAIDLQRLQDFACLHRPRFQNRILDGEILTLATSPRTELRRVLLGTRSDKIIRHSPVPVLVLPD